MISGDLPSPDRRRNLQLNETSSTSTRQLGDHPQVRGDTFRTTYVGDDAGDMRPGLEGIIASQRGIFARWQAIGCGITPREFDRLARPGGPWIRVRYGVYATRELWNSHRRSGRLKLRDRAALLVCEDDAVLSHTSAARLHGLPLYDVHEELSHVTRRSESQSGRVQADVKHHLAVLESGDTVELEGVLVTTPERTVVDLSREYGFYAGLVAADAALHAGADDEMLADMATRLTTQPGAPAVVEVVERADGRAQTPIESLGRMILLNMGIDDLELQYIVRFAEGGHAECDLYSPDLHHVFECDGRIKYRDQVDGYGNEFSSDDVVWLEKRREDKIRSQGLGFSRLTWPDVQPDSYARTSKRLWREIMQQAAASQHGALPPIA